MRIAAACLLISAVPFLSEPAGADTIVMNSHTKPAPPLTQAEIDRLKQVGSWDLEYTGSYSLSSNGSGGPVRGLRDSFKWTSREEDRQEFHVQARISGRFGPSDCHFGTSNPCIVQTTAGGSVDDSAFQEHAESQAFFSSSVCIPGDPIPSTVSYNNENRGGGSYFLNTLPANSRTKPDIEIDYTQNPPILYGNAHFPNVTIHHSFEGASSCHPSSPDEFDLIGYKVIFADWYPEGDGYPYGGDSQVRIEHGALVVRGVSDWTRTAVLCVPQFGLTPCGDPNAPTLAPFVEHYHSEWVLREHDCLDTNGDGNADDDGDGLCDNWETDGLDVDGDGTIDLPLNEAPYNADPEHKDLFVEVDYMDNPATGHTENPSIGALTMVKNAFARAPVTNPDGFTGVSLHFVGSDAAHPDPTKLVDGALPHTNRISFPEYINASCPATSFDDLKKSNFGTAAERLDANAAKILEAKARVFRYAIFAHQQADDADRNGVCTDNGSSGVAELPGNDLIVTVGGPDWKPLGSLAPIYSGNGPGACFTGENAETCAARNVEAATFMHEFGHTLGLHHGGSDDVNCKPNYLSVMNYSFQFKDAVSTRPLDYSGGVAGDVDDDPFAPLDETNLSEPTGIAGPLARNSVFGLNGRDAYVLLNHPIDWNADPNGRTDEKGVVADVARRDTQSACARGLSVDAQDLTFTQTSGFNRASVPAPSAFTVRVNGTTTLTPIAAAIANSRLYLTLPSPAAPADTFELDYAKPATNGLQTAAGVPYGTFTAFSVPNVTGQLQTLFARDDWATLQYDMRRAPAFADGVERQPQADPELTSADVAESASQMDFDGDGVSNAADNCPATYNPGQEDLDADGFGDDCEPVTAADDVEPASVEAISPSPNGSGWNNSDVTVSLTAADDPTGSGVKEIEYVMQGAQAAAERSAAGPATSPVVTAEGETSVKFRAVDNAGNRELPHAVTVRLDRTPPSIVATQDPPANASGWNRGDVTVSYACSDALSGVAACDPPSLVTGEGAGLTVTGNGADAAGNAAQVTVNGINIDRTPPAVTCSVTPSVLWPPKHKMIPIAATVDVADALSGSRGFTLTSITSSEPDSVNRKDKPGDIAGFAVGSASTTGQLRAEHLAKSPGRVYTLTWEGTDQAGNAASCSATVTVPKKRPR